MLYLEDNNLNYYLCFYLHSFALELGDIAHNIVLQHSYSVDLNIVMQQLKSHKVLSYYQKLHFL